MHVVNIDNVDKRVIGSHGEATIYQLIFGRGTENPDLTRSIASFWIMTVMPGGTNEPHSHSDEEQIYLIKEGEGLMVVGEEKREVKAGDAIYLPPKITHAFYNTWNEPCVIIAVGAKIH